MWSWVENSSNNSRTLHSQLTSKLGWRRLCDEKMALDRPSTKDAAPSTPTIRKLARF